MGKKRIIISVTNDLVADNRVHKVANTLLNLGYDVLTVGRKLKNSQVVNREYKTKRFHLFFKKSALFYAEFNCRLFFYLLFKKADVFLANDLDTLPANYLASKIRKKKLIYDSHEYFTEVPELVNRPKVKHIWEKIEKRILPNIKYSYTVCGSIADIYNKKYGINMQVVRNIPVCSKKTDDFIPDLFSEINTKKIILYQGAVNIGRGIEQVIKAMQFIENAVFLIIGDGDIKLEMEQLSRELNLKDKIIFIGKIPFQELSYYTKRADIGISIEENIGLNYYYALPNKLFDYIRANVPVLVSNLPEIQKITDQYKIGMSIENHSPEHIADKIKFMLNSPKDIKVWKENLKKASSELCWENEEKVLERLFI